MTLTLSGQCPWAQRLAPLLESAIDCVLHNVVPGRGPDEPVHYLRAGSGYPDPWTRDAAINAWQAGAWMLPQVSADTLAMVCEPDGTAVTWDDQWWDQISWVLGTHMLAMVSGDPVEAARGLRIGAATLARLDQRAFDWATRLYCGPAVMADGITGYPPALHDPGRPEASFVLDHAATHRIHCLSTNALYVRALHCLGDLAALAGEQPEPWHRRADELAARVASRFRTSPDEPFGYLIADGRLSGEQEGLGVALAILAGVVGGPDAAGVVAGVCEAPAGLPAVWPHFPGYDDQRFGRHGAAVWPMIHGVWAQAVATTGDSARFGADLERFCRLIEDSELAFFELYHPFSGDPDGGWQSGHQWASEPDQTWSASAFIGTVLYGLAGLRPGPDRLGFSPCLPPGTEAITLRGLNWRSSAFDLELRGSGSHVERVLADGRDLDGPWLPAGETPRVVQVHCSPRPGR